MSTLIDRYIDRALLCANRTPDETEVLREELKDHLQQKVEDLMASGLPREEAVFAALRQHGHPVWIGYQYRRKFPLLDIRSQGTACGVIAIGPRAVGIFAFGGMAAGVVACGGLSVGLVGIGGLSLGFLFAWAGLGIGGIVFAGAAIGLVATGGFACGLVAAGGQAIGAWVPQSHQALSFYTARDVPPLLKACEPILTLSLSASKQMGLIMTLYSLITLVLAGFQYREARRLDRGKDWLIED